MTGRAIDRAPAPTTVADDGGAVDRAKLYVVDDESIIRDGVCATLREAGWAVEGFASCEGFLDAYRQCASTCLVLDMHLPGMDGMELLGHIAAMAQGPAVVVMSGSSRISEAVKSLQDGASDFIEKPIVADRLIAAVTQALERTRHANAILALRDAAADSTGDLTVRQRQIMQLFLAGHPNKNIAADLGISQRTVEKHRASIMTKTGASSLPDLARIVACTHCALLN